MSCYQLYPPFTFHNLNKGETFNFLTSGFSECPNSRISFRLILFLTEHEGDSPYDGGI